MSKLTKRTIDAAAPVSADYILWDDELKGFRTSCLAQWTEVFLFQYQLGSRRQPRADARRVWYAYAGPGPTRSDAVTRRGCGGPLSGHCKEGGTRCTGSTPFCGDSRRLFDAFLAESRAKKKPSTVAVRPNVRRDIRPRLGARKAADITFARSQRCVSTWRDDPTSRIVRSPPCMPPLRSPNGTRCDLGDRTHGRRSAIPETARERFLSEAEFAALGAALTRAAAKASAPADTPTQSAGTGDAKAPIEVGRCAPPANPIAVCAAVLLLSGWREREALTLRWEFRTSSVLTRCCQRLRRAGIRPLGATIWRLLSTLPHVADSPYVFPGAEPGEPLRNSNGSGGRFATPRVSTPYACTTCGTHMRASASATFGCPFPSSPRSSGTRKSPRPSVTPTFRRPSEARRRCCLQARRCTPRRTRAATLRPSARSHHSATARPRHLGAARFVPVLGRSRSMNT